MDTLKLAVEARVPMVLVKTEDMVHVQEVLGWIAGTQVKATDGQTITADVMYSTAEPTAALWVTLKNQGKTVVYVNTKKSALHLDCGVMFPPKEMMEVWLGKWFTELEIKANPATLLPAFGGLTLKDAYEVVKMAASESEDLTITPKTVNRVRQGLVSKSKGITQVEADQEFYQPPEYLENWMAVNCKFFLKPPHPSLMPRGLLFDGPPGTGKTAGAKHLAQALGVPLYRLDIGAMKGKYVGDSEGALNSALVQIDQAAPCVVIFDEVEKVFGQQQDKGVTSNMLGALLWWLQEHKSQVLTVMTTNDVKSLPKELFREGRVDDVMVFNGLESMSEVMEFASTIWEKLAPQVGLMPKAGDLGAMMKDLEPLAMAGAVPQAKVQELVHKQIKVRLSKKGA